MRTLCLLALFLPVSAFRKARRSRGKLSILNLTLEPAEGVGAQQDQDIHVAPAVEKPPPAPSAESGDRDDDATEKKNAFYKEATSAGVSTIVSAVALAKDPSITSIGGFLSSAGGLASAFGPVGVAVGGVMSLVGGLFGLGGDPGPSNQDILDEMSKGFREFNERLDQITGRLDTIDSKLNLIGDQLNKIENRLKLMTATLSRIEGAVSEVKEAVDVTLAFAEGTYNRQAVAAYKDVLARHERLMLYLSYASTSTDPIRQNNNMRLYNESLQIAYEAVSQHRPLHFSENRIKEILNVFMRDTLGGRYCKVALIVKQIISARWAWYWIMYHRNLYVQGCKADCISRAAIGEAQHLDEDMKMMSRVIGEYKVSDIVIHSDEDLTWAQEKKHRLKGWNGFHPSFNISVSWQKGNWAEWGDRRNQDLYVVRSDYDECCHPRDYKHNYNKCGVNFGTYNGQWGFRMSKTNCSFSVSKRPFFYTWNTIKPDGQCVGLQLADQGCLAVLEAVTWDKSSGPKNWCSWEDPSKRCVDFPYAKSKCWD